MTEKDNEEWANNFDEETQYFLEFNDGLLQDAGSDFGPDGNPFDEQIVENDFVSWVVAHFFNVEEVPFFGGRESFVAQYVELQTDAYIEGLLEDISLRERHVLFEAFRLANIARSLKEYSALSLVAPDEFGATVAKLRTLASLNYCQACGSPAPIEQDCLSCGESFESLHELPPNRNALVPHAHWSNVFTCSECSAWALVINPDTGEAIEAYGYSSHAYQRHAFELPG